MNNGSYKKIWALLCLLLLASCMGSLKRLEDDIHLEEFGAPKKIEYYKAIPRVAFQVEENPTFVITDKEDVERAIKEIERANDAGPWKGAGWNRIKIYYDTTTIWLNTNNKVIGTNASGTFYRLKTNNFIIRELKKAKP